MPRQELVCDIETDGLLNELTRIHCLVAKDARTGEVFSFGPGEIEAGLKFLESGDVLVFHNGLKFDVPAIKSLYPQWRPRAVIRDSILCTRLIWPNIKELDFEGKFPGLPKQLYGRHSLEAWGYRLGVLKGEFGKTSDWQTFTPEMMEYCKGDAEVGFALWTKIKSKNYSERAIQLEHDFCEVIFLQEQHGFCFDRKAAVELYSTLGQRRLELERELQSMFKGWWQDMKKPEFYQAANGAQFATKKEAGKLAKTCVAGPVKRKHIPFNPSSRDHIARVLIENHGWKPKQFTPDGKPTVDESVLEALPYPEAILLNEYFLIEKRIGQLAEGQNAWLKLEEGGRIYGEVCTNGAVTGRCTHNRPNIAQVPSVKTEKDKEGNEHVLYGLAGGFGAECRSLFVAPPGYKLVGCDASSLELRCLANYMARYDGGKYAEIVISGDIHEENRKAAGLDNRKQAKGFIYAYLYGAGDEKIGSLIGKGAKEGKKLKAQFLAKTPALKRLKEDIAVAAKRGFLIGLDGRHLPIRSEHAALNTLLQSAGALLMKQATVFAYQELTRRGYVFGVDFAQVASVHDENQLEAREEIAHEVGEVSVQAMVDAGKHFNFRCRIDGNYKVGGSWKDTH
jgi:DNA polymerase I